MSGETAEQEQSEPKKAASSTARSRLWELVNSALGLWLLSSVVWGGAVYFYQQWQDSKHEQQMTTEKAERIQLEIAGRIAQFGKWVKDTLVVKEGASYRFQDGVTKNQISEAVADLADIPRHSRSPGRAYIQEVFPEFSNRNLISLYAELSSINTKALEKDCPEGYCDLVGDRATITISNKKGQILANHPAISAADMRLSEEILRRHEYKTALVTLLDSNYLIGYGLSNHDLPNHDSFVKSFEVTFLTPDIRNSTLPSTDCIERTDDCQLTANAGTSRIALK
jgi:hypothetical protein